MITRVNITLPDGLLAEADELARAQRLTRSGLVREVLAERVEAASAGTGASVETSATLGVDRLLGAFFSARDDIEAAWLFGSAARGDTGRLSDIDVAILAVGRFERDGRLHLALELAGRLPGALGVKRVDVVSLPDAPVLLAHRIVTGGRVVFGAGRRTAAEAELSAITAYVEFRPVLDESDGYLAKRMASYAAV